MLKLTLLGAPQITLDGNSLPNLSGKKAPALLIYLAVTGRTATRDTLASLFWADVESVVAKKNLRDILPVLRRAIGEHLIITRHTVAWNPDQPYWLDMEQFCTVLETVGPETTVADLRTAINLYQGEFLEGFYIDDAPLFEEWVTTKREWLYKLAMQGLHLLAERHLEQHEYSAGLLVTQRALALEPTNERAHRQQMRLLAYSGQSGAALAQYALCRRLLTEEIGVEPALETTLLAEEIRNGELIGEDGWSVRSKGVEERRSGGAFLPGPTLPHRPSSPHNLPRQLTLLVGREIERATLCTKLLAPNCAWLTLTGEGGIGKTRLALAAGEALLPHFRDGVWFVALADLIPSEDLPDQLVIAIGRALRFTFSSATPVLEQLLTHLQHKQALLILDNFEQIASGTAFILKLLQETQAIKVLVTSRARLNFQAEHLFRLDGLAVPEEKESQALNFARLLDYSSVDLFVQRAAQLVSNFALTAENCRPIVRICQFLEGWPLGLELAATLVRTYTCAQIADEIQHHYASLATTLQDLPIRQQSIHAVFTASWRLLTTEEAEILAQCAVFRGGFTYEAAAVITGATVGLLHQLEDKSLIQQLNPKRFTMHELLGQYTAHQLHKSPSLEQQAHERHCSYFAQFLDSHKENFQLGAHALDIVLADLDNIRASWRWAVDQDKLTTLFTALKPLAHLYSLAGLYQEAVATFAQAVGHLRPLMNEQSQPTPLSQNLFMQLLLEQADFCIKLAQMTQAERLIQEAQQLIPQLTDAALETKTYLRLGDVAWAQGNYTLHRTAYEKSLALARASGMQQIEAHALSNLGMNYDLVDEYQQAIGYYHAALAIAEQSDHLHQMNVIYNNLGVSYAMLGDFARALYYYSQTLQVSRQLGDQEGIAFAYLNLGAFLKKLGDWEQAKANLEQAHQRFRHLKDRRLIAKTRINLGLVAYYLNEDVSAEHYCQQALHAARKYHFRAVEAEALTVLGQILTKQQNLALAADLFAQAHRLWQELGREKMVTFAKAGLAYVALLGGDRANARQFVEEILATPIDAATNIIHEPGFIFLVCYQVLITHQDPRAAQILQTACDLVQTQAATIQDPALRQSFLQRVTANRALMALAQRT